MTDIPVFRQTLVLKVFVRSLLVNRDAVDSTVLSISAINLSMLVNKTVYNYSRVDAWEGCRE